MMEKQWKTCGSDVGPLSRTFYFILPLPLLLLRTHLRTPLAFVPPFSGLYFLGFKFFLYNTLAFFIIIMRFYL